jgi:hypothetical protein
VGIHAPWISHLLFADDCIVFTQASRTGANRLNDILEAYNRGSGQLVNREKSAIFFSKNCPEETKSEVTQSLNIQREALEEKYLGLPTAVGRSTTDAFEKLSSRTLNLVNGWSEKKLDFAGREVLIKAVAQSVPTYSMSCFQLSKTTCKRLTSIIARTGGEEMVIGGKCTGGNGQKLLI